MVFEKKTYKEIASDILTRVVGGEIKHSATYDPKTDFYELSNQQFSKLLSVEGLHNGQTCVFQENVDYRIVSNQAIQWLRVGRRPDVNSIFVAKFLLAVRNQISDVNVGSVLRTLTEAVSREIELLYLQTEQAYLAGFIETANGQALDFVVALLGMKRKQSQASSGVVTFTRYSDPELLTMVGEAHVADGSIEYPLNKPLAKEINRISGTYKSANMTFRQDIDYTLLNNNIRWSTGGHVPDQKTVFHVDYTAFKDITIPLGTSVATLALKQNEAIVFKTIEKVMLKKTVDKRWEADVPVISTVTGIKSNVLAGTIIVMPTAIPDVESVINKTDIQNGIGAETDTELRERAKHALEFAGKATYMSLESAIRSVEGVNSILIQDMPDGVPGVVKVVVSGGDKEKIQYVIDNTRAAGIKVDVTRPIPVQVNVSLMLLLHKNAQEAVAAAEAEQRIRSYISSLEIGQDVLFSRIIESLVSIENVWDVQDLKLHAQRPDGSSVDSELENIEISADERAEPKLINVTYMKKKSA